MEIINVKGFVSFTLAIILLFIGKYATQHSSLLRKYSIPEPVIGGFVCAAVVSLLYYLYPLPIKILYSVVSSDTKARRSMMTMVVLIEYCNVELVFELATRRASFEVNIFVVRKFRLNQLDLQLPA